LPPQDWAETDGAIQKLLAGEFDWIVFSSSNGIHTFFDRATSFSLPNGKGTLKIAVVGKGTDSTLYQRTGMHADVVPETFTAEGIAEALSADARPGKRFLHLRASRGRDVLKRLLTEAGGSVTEIVVYRSVDRTHSDPKIAEFMKRGGIDFVTVTSSAIAKSLVNMFGELLRQTCLVSISPITSQTLSNLGFPPHREAEEASLAGIVNVLPPPFE
jgi:uroporphyrinogen III methyltransferase/synthase